MRLRYSVCCARWQYSADERGTERGYVMLFDYDEYAAVYAARVRTRR